MTTWLGRLSFCTISNSCHCLRTRLKKVWRSLAQFVSVFCVHTELQHQTDAFWASYRRWNACTPWYFFHPLWWFKVEMKSSFKKLRNCHRRETHQLKCKQIFYKISYHFPLFIAWGSTKKGAWYFRLLIDHHAHGSSRWQIAIWQDELEVEVGLMGLLKESASLI